MSDDATVPAVEPGEAAQDAATEQASPPWGDDFDAQRAWDTITKLRAFEKPAREFERIKSDEDARAEFLKELGYEFAEDDEPDTPDEELFDDDDPVAPLNEKLTQLEQWKQQQEAKEAAAAIRSDLDTFNEGSDWELDDDDRQAIVARANRQNPNGFGPDELRKAHDWFIARLDRAAEAAVERAKTPKPKAPHVTAAGKPATGTKPIEDMTPEEHRAWARERYQQMNQG
jgi:hypothetical protein